MGFTLPGWLKETPTALVTAPCLDQSRSRHLSGLPSGPHEQDSRISGALGHCSNLASGLLGFCFFWTQSKNKK